MAISIDHLTARKQKSEKIACLTAYDSSFARLLDEAGVDVILVGDSLGMVMQGQRTTLPVSLDHMVYHAQCVSRVSRHALIMADLPFMSCATVELAVNSATRLMQEAQVQMLKVEGGAHRVKIVEMLSLEGIPICAHLGLTPQTVHQLGGFRLQGKEPASAAQMIDDALALEDAGARMVILECVPSALAEEITNKLVIPTIGIGAGLHVDGQVLVTQDMLGMSSPSLTPRFVKNFMLGAESIQAAIVDYVRTVRDSQFPLEEHTLV